LLPRWLAEERDLRAFVHDGPCIDIGTPERYQSAQLALAAVEAGTDGSLIAAAKERA
jgi:NDP-sugar pyrophosphorylase family protein